MDKRFKVLSDGTLRDRETGEVVKLTKEGKPKKKAGRKK